MPGSDDLLLEAWSARRDEAALQDLCRRYAGLILSTCRRLGAPDPDEAAQAVALVLARRAGTVRQGGLAGWLIETARRVAANQRRSARARAQHEQEAAMVHERQRHETMAGPAETAWPEARTHLDAALASLGAGQRDAIVRFYLVGRTQAEIAAELGCSVDAVKNRIHAGLGRLRDLLTRRGVRLGLAALTAGLAAEASAAAGETAAIETCLTAVQAPATVPGAAILAQGTISAMTMKTTLIGVAAGLLLPGIAAALLMAGATPAPTPPVGPGSATAAAIAPVPTAGIALDGLDAAMTVRFTRATLADVLDAVFHATGVPAAVLSGDDPGRELTTVAAPMTAREVLALAQRTWGVEMEAHGKVILVWRKADAGRIEALGRALGGEGRARSEVMDELGRLRDPRAFDLLIAAADRGEEHALEVLAKEYATVPGPWPLHGDVAARWAVRAIQAAVGSTSMGRQPMSGCLHAHPDTKVVVDQLRARLSIVREGFPIEGRMGLYALSRLSGPEAPAALLEIVLDGRCDERMRREALACLGLQRVAWFRDAGDAHVPALQRVIRSGDAELAMAAIRLGFQTLWKEHLNLTRSARQALAEIAADQQVPQPLRDEARDGLAAADRPWSPRPPEPARRGGGVGDRRPAATPATVAPAAGAGGPMDF